MIYVTEEKIREIMERFSLEVKKACGASLRTVILYGSCARGDFSPDSDVDIMVLLDTPGERISEERKKYWIFQTGWTGIMTLCWPR